MATREAIFTDGGHFAVMPGTLVFLDTFAGMVPAKVVACHDRKHVTVRLTANRAAYRKGEQIKTHVSLAIPRSMVSVRHGQYRIAGFEIVAYPAPGKDYAPEPGDWHISEG